MDNEPFDDKRSSSTFKVPKVYRRNSALSGRPPPAAEAAAASFGLLLQMAPRHHSMGQKVGANRFFEVEAVAGEALAGLFSKPDSVYHFRINILECHFVIKTGKQSRK